MSFYGHQPKAVNVAAFILTYFGCFLAVIAISLTNWWSVDSADARTYRGVWSRQDCKASGMCEPDSLTLYPGFEALFISKVFATFTAVLSLVAVFLHSVYAVSSLPTVRTATIFILSSEAVFGQFAVFVFLGFYRTIHTGSPSIGAAFYVFICATLICFAAAAVTTWASVEKAPSSKFPELENRIYINKVKAIVASNQFHTSTVAASTQSNTYKLYVLLDKSMMP